jgi:transcriptional regulator with XRE-family HTH domain
MKKQTLGMMISSLRKEKGMTQLELAEKMGVTDKAVSKWERDLSYPDINSIPKLAEIFGVSVDELMQVKTETKENISKNKIDGIVDTILKGIGVAMGIAVTVLSILGELEANTAFVMLGIGLASISISLLKDKQEEK